MLFIKELNLELNTVTPNFVVIFVFFGTASSFNERILRRPITTGANSAMNQSQFLAIICNSLKAREESRVHGAIGLGLACRWLENWR